ncbi:STAS domain-containing protein [Streptomyces sp. NPDC058108]|uniref:STAS domain-containing protein n=1 Tax=Streptomyces sp. NPDC058108 TaxID=3346344 RepID=UPI0036E19371
MISVLPIHTAAARGRPSALKVTGAMGLATASVLEQAVNEVLTDRTVILDLTGVTFCDSSGLNSLLRLRRRAQDGGGQLALAAPSRQMMRLLSITGAATVFAIYTSLAECSCGHLGARRHESSGSCRTTRTMR